MIPATMQRLPSAIPVSFPTRHIKKVNKEDDPSDDAEASQRHSRLLSNYRQIKKVNKKDNEAGSQRQKVNKKDDHTDDAEADKESQ